MFRDLVGLDALHAASLNKLRSGSPHSRWESEVPRASKVLELKTLNQSRALFSGNRKAFRASGLRFEDAVC